MFKVVDGVDVLCEGLCVSGDEWLLYLFINRVMLIGIWTNVYMN